MGYHSGIKIYKRPTVWAHAIFVIKVVRPFCFYIGIIGEFFMKKVAIIMGSDSDLPILEKTIDTLKSFGVPFSVNVFSAHRTPAEAHDFAASAKENGYGVIICAAGMAAHLAGAIAANTILPVIGIPCKSSGDGMDALLSTVQMPSGVPVATVAINGGVNAGLLAIQMLAIENQELSKKLADKKEADRVKVLEKNQNISQKYNG